MSDPIEQYKDRLRKAMARMTALRDALDAERRRPRAPIAIVGIGCRLPPDIDDPDRFFDALLAGHDATTPVPADRGAAPVDDLPPGGYLRDVRGFDAGYFGLSPREAAAIDPQQRLLLEVTCDALERAGLPPDALPADRVGVWLGLAPGGYLARALDHAPDIYAITGNGGAFASGRLAYALGLRGPALALDTACSSSLVALHLAVASLRRGETDVAIVGGAHVVTESQATRLLLDSGALSPTGRCRPFDAAADGFTRGEGAVALVLRRLDDARAAGDPIQAIIRGTAVNQDGRSTGLTAPNVLAQQTMLAAALADAGVEPASIGYIEAHGTGTALGDPIELDALTAALDVDGAPPCVLGAVKANVGHLEAAAGLVGLVKAVGALRRGVVPPTPGYTTPNPHLRLAGTRFVIPTAPTALAGDGPHRAGVSAFGMSGTNAHVILEAPPPPDDPPAADAPPLLALSARDPAALAAHAAQIADALDAGLDPAAAARTLARRRTHHPHRLAITAADPRPALRAFAAGELPDALTPGDGEDRGAPVFVCAGQGTLWPGIGRLLRAHPAAWAVIEAAAPIVARHGDFDLVALLDHGDPDALHRTAHAQPATVAVTLALAAWLDAHGVRPAALVGHSVGELSAACLAGALDRETTLRLACARGRAMAGARVGGLLAVALDPDALRLPDGLAIAAHNGPRATVVGGDGPALDALAARLAADGVRSRRLPVPHAFHTAHMEPTLPVFAHAAGPMDPAPLTRPLYSTVTGGRVDAAALDLAHWQAGIRQPVRFADAIAAAAAAGHRLYVELGPHPALGAAIEAAHPAARAVPTARRDATTLWPALGALWAHRGPVALAAAFAPGPVAPVPTYPWQRRPHWIDDTRAPAPTAPAVEVAPEAPAPPADHAAIGRRVRAEVAAVLGLAPGDPLPARRGLFELGFDSMMSVELARRLSRALARPIGPTAVFDHPTVAGLTDHLAGAAPDDAPTDARPAAHAPIAIVGMACRLPGGADDPETLWDHLDAGRIAIGPVPPDRWDAAAYHDPDPSAAGKMYATESGFLTGDLRLFDAAAFGISPAEARALDPQQRLLLELTHEALEAAGHPPDRLEGTRTGIYVGIATSDYGQHVARRPLAEYEAAFATGCADNTAAGRIAYTLGTRGPALAIDTACSSSLVGLHLAVEALRRGDIDRAIVAGTNLILDPTIGVLYSRMSALAPDSRCKAFDAAADGLVRGEGVAVVVLERLDDARRARDHVDALVLGAAVNHDGRSSGLTVPSGPAQTAVVRAALRDAGVDGAAIEYVETHGTGTPLGDPIEANALVAALGPGRERPLLLGSVKANLGHLEPAAGLAGLIKVVGALRRRAVPPQPTFARLNPAIEPGDVELLVPTAPTPIPGRLAGLSSFGVSGTNAHVIVAAPDAIDGITDGINGIVEATPDATDGIETHAGDGALLLPISARDPERRRELAAAWRARLDDAATPIADLCAAAALRRAHSPHRLAITGPDRAALTAALDRWLAAPDDPDGDPDAQAADARDRRVAWVFSGQGGYWLGMARALWRADPAFTRAFEAAAAASARHGGPDLVDALHADALDDKRVLHPLMLGLQVALAAALRARGLTPAAVVGHSSGELAAAVVAGALDLDDALRVSVARSAAVHAVIGHGAMAVVGLGPDAVAAVLAPGADVAVHNAPGEVIVSGDDAAIEATEAACAAANVFFRRVKGADGAGHSHHFDPHLDAFRAAIDGLTARTPRLPLYPTARDPRSAAPLDADYWVANLRRRVRFADAIEAMAADGLDAFVEVGPHPVLLRPIGRVAPDAVTVATLRRDTDDRLALARALGALYVAGAAPDWGRLYPAGSPALPLPRHPWRRAPYWMPPGRDAARGRHPLISHTLDVARTGERVVECALDRGRRDLPPPVEVQGAATLDPALIIACVAAAGDDRPMALALGDARPFSERVDVQIALPEAGPFALHIRVDGGRWRPLGEGRWLDPLPHDAALDAARAACATPIDGDPLAARGLVVAPALDLIEQRWSGPGAALARLRPGGTWATAAAVSSALWLLAALPYADATPVEGELMWPTAIERIELPAEARWAHAALRAPAHPVTGALGEITFFDRAGRPVGRLAGVRLRPASRALARAAVADRLDGWTYTSRWVAAPRADAAPLAPGEWLLIGPAADTAPLAAALTAAGHRATAAEHPPPLRAELRGVVDLRPPAEPVEAARRAVALCRAVIEAGVARLVTVTRGGQPVADGDAPDPRAAIGWTITRTLSLEHPEITARLIDLDPAAPATEHAATEHAATLAVELTAPDREDLVAWRAGARHAQRLTPAALPWPAAPLHLEGAALVTGGLGGVGLQLAGWLADRGADRLVLTSRRGEAGSDPATREALAALRARGVTVEAPAVDVTDAAAMAALIDATAPTVIVHAAGATGFAPIATLDPDTIAPLIAAKVDGALLLDRLAPTTPLVCLSSASATWGAAGLSLYAAANHALDLLAHRRRAEGRPALTVAWGGWAGGGMTDEATRAGAAEIGLLSSPAPHLLEALDAAMQADVAQLTIAEVDWRRFKPLLEARGPRPLLDPIELSARVGGDGPLARALDALPAAARWPALLDAVAARAARALGLDDPARLDRDAGFFQLGMDSVMTVTLRRALELDLGGDLPPTLVLDQPTARALAGWLGRERLGVDPDGEAPAPAPEPTPAPAPAEDLDDLSEDDLEALLLAELEDP